MWARAWRPAVCDESPKRKGDQKQDRENFEGGTHAEPGDKQRVRLLVVSGMMVSRNELGEVVDCVTFSRWLTAVYDRTACCFWQRFSAKVMIDIKGFRVRRPMKGWCQVTGKVLAWTQYPMSVDFVDPEVA